MFEKHFKYNVKTLDQIKYNINTKKIKILTMNIQFYVINRKIKTE